MRQSFTLFPLGLTPRLWVQDQWFTNPQINPSNQPPLIQYSFRRGGFWKPMQIWSFPAPPQWQAGNDPPLKQYAFNPGYYSPQKIWTLPVPPVWQAGNDPILRQYAFRRGGFWQTQKIWTDVSPTAPVIVIITPPATIVAPKGGGGLADRRVYVMRRYPKTVALILAGEYDAAWAMLARESKSIGN